MDQLQQARAQIDEIDAKMAALFEQRMQAVGQVAQYKARTGKQVFDPAREALVLEKNTARVQNPELQPYYREFLKKALAVSRAYQHVLIGQDVAAYQGVEGAWSHIALRQLFPFAKAQAYSTWNEVVEAVERGDAYCGVLPFENSNAGDVSAVLDLLYAHPGLKVARMCDLPIRQDLLALPGAQLSEIKTVISHQQALAQSGPFLKLHHFATKAWGNTADAARYVAEQGDQTLAAIASAETAKLYGLQILAEGVNEDGEEYIDYSKCSQPENSLISVKAEITPECKTAKTQTLEYTFYIDTTGPNSKKPTFSYKTEDWGWGPESMYTISVESNEAWYQDYDMSITIEYDEETGEFFASAFTSTYFPTAQPNGEGVHGMSESGSMMYTDSRTDIFLGYDYAGNCSAYTITGSQLDDNISLSAETDSIYIGEEVTIQNTDVDDYAMLLNWEVSDPEIAEIVSSDDSSVTIKGLKRGDVAVTASVGDFKKSVTIHVLDKSYEDLKGKFQDISGHWAEDTILEAVYRGLFNGVSSDLFDPDSAITRAMFVTVLYRMEGQPAVDQKAGFTDVAEGSCYAAAVDWAAKNGIVNGVAKNVFAPDASITREQIAAMLYRYAGAEAAKEDKLSAFPDAAKVSDWAKEALNWAVASGLINGVADANGTANLEPQATATRAQIATILMRWLEK